MAPYITYAISHGTWTETVTESEGTAGQSEWEWASSYDERDESIRGDLERLQAVLAELMLLPEAEFEAPNTPPIAAAVATRARINRKPEGGVAGAVRRSGGLCTATFCRDGCTRQPAVVGLRVSGGRRRRKLTSVER